MKPKHPTENWHKQDILAAVRKKKKSLAALSRENNLSSGTLSNVLRKPWPRGEKIIADTLGLEPENIWPTRYSNEKRFKSNEN